MSRPSRPICEERFRQFPGSQCVRSYYSDPVTVLPQEGDIPGEATPTMGEEDLNTVDTVDVDHNTVVEVNVTREDTRQRLLD